MSTCANVGSFIESKTSVVQTSNVGFTSEVSDYLVVHTGHGLSRALRSQLQWTLESGTAIDCASQDPRRKDCSEVLVRIVHLQLRQCYWQYTCWPFQLTCLHIDTHTRTETHASAHTHIISSTRTHSRICENV